MKPKDKIDALKRDYYAGKISYDEAKALAQPFIDEMNQLAKAVAKKYNQRAVKFSFAGVFR